MRHLSEQIPPALSPELVSTVASWFSHPNEIKNENAPHPPFATRSWHEKARTAATPFSCDFGLDRLDATNSIQDLHSKLGMSKNSTAQLSKRMQDPFREGVQENTLMGCRQEQRAHAVRLAMQTPQNRIL